MDLTKERTICLGCKNFSYVEFMNRPNRPSYSCLVNKTLFDKVSEDKYYDDEGLKCKLPIVSCCSTFSPIVKESVKQQPVIDKKKIRKLI